jgi:hypothetical protein
MAPKIKTSPNSAKPAARLKKPQKAADATNQKTWAKAASRQSLIAIKPASGSANHARHHAPVKAQS